MVQGVMGTTTQVLGQMLNSVAATTSHQSGKELLTRASVVRCR
jgi:hypothetical protein